MIQRGLTLISEIIPGHVDALKTLLNEIGRDIDDHGLIDFYALSSVHFMRWVVLDAAEVRGHKIPPQLVLSTNFDGRARPHLIELATKASEGLAEIYAHCKG